MSTELTVRDNDATLAPLAQRIQYAEMISKAGIIPSALKTPANVLVAIDYGAALGIPAMQAINSIHVIEGKASMSADLMAALVRKAGHRLRVWEEANEKREPVVHAELVRADDPDFTFRVTWTMDKARQAGLIGGKGKANWDKYGNQMLRARAISEICRQAATDALAGIVYTREELESSTEPARPTAVPAAQAVEVAPETDERPWDEYYELVARLGWDDPADQAKLAVWASRGAAQTPEDMDPASFGKLMDYARQRAAEADKNVAEAEAEWEEAQIVE